MKPSQTVFAHESNQILKNTATCLLYAIKTFCCCDYLGY